MYEYQARVTASQCDKHSRQTIVSLANLLQDCSIFWLESEPTLEKWLAASGVKMLISSRQVDVLRYATYGERLTVRTGLFDCKPYMGYRNTGVYDESGTLIAASWAIGPFFDPACGKMARAPKEIVESVCIDPKLAMEYLSKKIAAPADDALTPLPALHAQRSDIDFNNHVNNAQYLRMGFEQLPADFQVSRLRVEYKSQAHLGDALIPHIGTGVAGGTYLSLRAEDGSVFANMEFTDKPIERTSQAEG